MTQSWNSVATPSASAKQDDQVSRNFHTRPSFTHTQRVILEDGERSASTSGTVADQNDSSRAYASSEDSDVVEGFLGGKFPPKKKGKNGGKDGRAPSALCCKDEGKGANPGAASSIEEYTFFL